MEKATEKQKTAIKNLTAWLRCGIKTHHSVLSKQELAEIDKLSKKEAGAKIQSLIADVRYREDMQWEAPSIWDYAF